MVIKDKPLSSIKADIVHAFLSVSNLFCMAPLQFHSSVVNDSYEYLNICFYVLSIRSKDFPHRNRFDWLGRKLVFLHLQTPFWFVFHFYKMLVCDVSILPAAASFIRGQWKINTGHESLAYRCCASRGLWEFSASFRPASGLNVCLKSCLSWLVMFSSPLATQKPHFCK